MCITLCAALFACSDGRGVGGVTVSPAVISPNADGREDVARIQYTVSGQASISIFLTDASGKRFNLRSNEQRAPSPAPYELLFSGVADGRLMPVGDYTWHVESDGSAGRQSFSGKLQIKDAIAPYPEIKDFSLSTQSLSPNRDAIDDHVYVNAFLTAPARFNVYVTGPNGYRFDVPRREGIRIVQPGNGEMLPPGRYEFDYDGGINSNAEPPPDGAYVLIAETQDAIGQRHTLTRQITLRDSGRPQAEITLSDGDGMQWSRRGTQTVLQVGDTLYFTTTVRNTGSVPIRTAGPFSDPEGKNCYKMTENWYTKGFQQEPGIFRVGVNYDGNPGADHPFRWGIGSLAELDVVEQNGFKLYYLGINKQTVVRGCIVLDQIPVRNPFYIFGGFIQEDVDMVNTRVTPLQIELVRK